MSKLNMADTVPSLKLNSGYDVPVLGLGTFSNYQEGLLYPVTKAAIDVGYRFFDTAWYYGTEPEVGRAVREKIAEGVVTREEMFISTKLWTCFLEPDKVEKMCRESLSQLGLEYLDLYLIHWPTGFQETENPRGPKGSCPLIPSTVHYTDTWKIMECLVEKGLTRSIGVCNFNKDQLQRLLSLNGLKYKPAMLQIEVTPLFTNTELIEFCQANDIAVTAYAPLGAPGMIYIPDDSPKLLELETVKNIAERHNKSPAQIILKWGTQRGCSVIPSTTVLEYLQENIQIFDFSLSSEEMASISALNIGHRINCSTPYSHHPEYPF